MAVRRGAMLLLVLTLVLAGCTGTEVPEPSPSQDAPEAADKPPAETEEPSSPGLKEDTDLLDLPGKAPYAGTLRGSIFDLYLRNSWMNATAETVTLGPHGKGSCREQTGNLAGLLLHELNATLYEENLTVTAIEGQTILVVPSRALEVPWQGIEQITPLATTIDRGLEVQGSMPPSTSGPGTASVGSPGPLPPAWLQAGEDARATSPVRVFTHPSCEPVGSGNLTLEPGRYRFGGDLTLTGQAVLTVDGPRDNDPWPAQRPTWHERFSVQAAPAELRLAGQVVEGREFGLDLLGISGEIRRSGTQANLTFTAVQVDRDFDGVLLGAQLALTDENGGPRANLTLTPGEGEVLWVRLEEVSHEAAVRTFSAQVTGSELQRAWGTEVYPWDAGDPDATSPPDGIEPRFQREPRVWAFLLPGQTGFYPVYLEAPSDIGPGTYDLELTVRGSFLPSASLPITVHVRG